MAEHPFPTQAGSSGAAEGERAPGDDPRPHPPGSHRAYLKVIDGVRKTVAVVMVLCGVLFAVCARWDDYLTRTLREDSGVWGWGVKAAVAGTVVCLVAAILLIVEHLARPAAQARFTLRSVLLRSLLMVFGLSVIAFWMVTAYGPIQGIGATAGCLLAMAALHERLIARRLLTILAVLVLSPTLLSTQSAYQYARRHADEIVAAGCRFAEQCEADHLQEIPLDDARIPRVLRKLGASDFHVDDDHVHIHVPESLAFSEREFAIDRACGPDTRPDTVWVTSRPKGLGPMKIGDRLWMTTD